MVFEGAPYYVALYWVGSGRKRHFVNFKAILKIKRINSFVKLQRNLTQVFEWWGALTNFSLLGSQAKLDIPSILRRS